jgi:hypothetical protein
MLILIVYFSADVLELMEAPIPESPPEHPTNNTDNPAIRNKIETIFLI